MREKLKIFKPNLPFIGMNSVDDELSLPSNVLVRAYNMEPDKNGLRTRPGFFAYSTSGLPSTAIDGAYVYKKSDGNKTLLVAANGGIYKEGLKGEFSLDRSGYTKDNPMDFVTLADLAIAGNGKNKLLKFNGTSVKDLEVTAPTFAPVAAPGASGSLTGVFQYKNTFVSASGAETNAGPASTAVTASSQSIDLSNIPIGGSDVVARKIYRTLAGGTVYYWLATINDNVTTTYNDDLVDSSLSTILAPTTHDAPPDKAKFPTVYKQYLFVVDPAFPTSVFFSHQNLPEIFNTSASTGYIMVIGLNDGEAIIGMRALRSSLYVFKERSTWPIQGSLPDDFKTTPTPLTSSIGLYHRSIANVDIGSGDMLVGLARDGFYMFDGFTYKSISFQPQAGINIQDFVDGLDKNKLNWAYGFNDIKHQQYRCAVTEAGMGYNNKEFVWDYRHNRVAIYDRPYNVALEHNNEVLIGLSGSSAYNGMYQIGGFNDNGDAISIWAEWPWWAVSNEVVAIFDRINIDTTLQGNYSANVNIFIDGDNSNFTLNLSGAPLWGSVNWGATNWSGIKWGSVAWATGKGKYRTKVPLRIVGSDGVNLKGSYMKVILTHNGLNEPVTINGMTVYYQPTNEIAGFETDQTAIVGGIAT